MVELFHWFIEGIIPFQSGERREVLRPKCSLERSPKTNDKRSGLDSEEETALHSKQRHP
jgi:hypothetical protein